MLLKLIIITAILVGFLVLALGIRMWLDPKSEMAFHSCSEKPGETGACSACQIRDISNCKEAK